jgi:hypothetical protein
LATQGVPTKVEAAHAIVQNTGVIINGETVITAQVDLDGGHERIDYCGIEALGQPAAKANRRLVLGKYFWFELDVPLRDSDGRLLAYASVEHLMVNVEFVHQGYAHVSPREVCPRVPALAAAGG